MSQYKTEKSGANGTVTVTNGSSMVTGSGTAFLSNVQAGNSFKIQEQNAIYNINAVISDTEIIISPVYAGITASAAKFAIARDFTESGLYEFSIGDVDWYFLMSLNMRNIDTTVANQNLGNIFKGIWDASANIPVIPTAAPENIGWSYTVSVAGTYNSVVYSVGDTIRSNGSAWFRIPASSTSAPSTWGDGVYVGTVSPTLISYDDWLAVGKVGYWGFIDISTGSSTSTISVTSSGGAVVSGSATISSSSSSSNVSVSGTGGAVVGGSATISKTATQPVTSTGGAIVGGAATISSSTAGTSSVSVSSIGGAVVGGSATVSGTHTRSVTSVGGAVAGGSATISSSAHGAVTYINGNSGWTLSPEVGTSFSGGNPLPYTGYDDDTYGEIRITIYKTINVVAGGILSVTVSMADPDVISSNELHVKIGESSVIDEYSVNGTYTYTTLSGDAGPNVVTVTFDNSTDGTPTNASISAISVPGTSA